MGCFFTDMRREKHRDPPVFPQENGETGPQAGATALLGRAASAAYGAGARSSGDQSLSNKMGPPQNSFCGE